MKAQKCRLIFHGSYKEIDMGVFDSMRAARKYTRECWTRPYTIRKIVTK